MFRFVTASEENGSTGGVQGNLPQTLRRYLEFGLETCIEPATINANAAYGNAGLELSLPERSEESHPVTR